MKLRLLSLTLLTAVFLTPYGMAQQPLVGQTPQPDAGFERKEKTTPRSSGLAGRLNAVVMPVPKSRAARSGLLASGAQRPTTQLLRLRVVRDSATGLPVYIERKVGKNATANRGARLSAAAAASAAYQFIGQVGGLLKVDNPRSRFTVDRTETDQLGQTHVHLAQTHRGVPVHQAELVAHLTDGAVTLLNGRYQPVPDHLSTTPKLNLADVSARALSDVGQMVRVRTFGDNLLKLKQTEGALCVFPLATGNVKLAYQITVRPNLLDRWEYVVDALTGEVLDKYNHTCTLTPPIQASGRDLNGQTRQFQTYQQGNGYYLMDVTRPMFDAAKSELPGDPVGAIWTLDARNSHEDSLRAYQLTSTNNTDWSPTAVSAHYNAGVAYDYYQNTFGRNGLNGQGGTMISIVNVTDEDGKGLENAFWNGKLMAYGNGGEAFKPLAGALDVAGHEMTHGVISNSANLQYRGQSGAINESMADVFGVLIDRDDWKLGEDVVKPGIFAQGALRDVSNPNQGGKDRDPNGYQPATMSEYVNTTEDNGGVHINSGIPNFAFYKFATVVGKEKAERVYYRALTTYLVRTSQFLDLRLAVIKAAGDLYGATGAEVTAARSAFDAVGIVEGTQTTPGKQPDVPVASGQDLLLLTETDSENLYSTVVGVTPARFDKKTNTKLLHRPSVTDDGSTAYYVSSDKRIRAVNLTGTPTERIISDEPIWDNVAISKDGTKLAALTADQDGSIYVYSYAKQRWTEFELYNPTYTEGVETGDVRYADSFEWDFRGENIIYDAYNELTNASGEAIDYWDVGLINVWNSQTGDFAQGDIQKLFENLEEGESIGNPSFSKNSPDVVAFDYFNELEDTYYVVTTDLSTGDLKGVYENNTLGFPSYSRQDNRMVFTTESDGEEAIAVINLAADKLSPSGEASVLYTGAKWPVWYTQATRTLPAKVAQTITFNAIADRYTTDGDLTLRATCSSNLTVSFQVRSGPATLTGSTLRFSGPGVVTVRAMQAGNDQFQAATSVDRTFTVILVTGTEPAWSDALLVYPNPAVQSLTIELPTNVTLDGLTLRNLTGVTVTKPPVRPRQRTATLDVGHLPKGMYLLQIQTPKGTAQRKVVKE